MRSPRWWSGAALAAGIVIGTAADRLPDRPIPRAGEYLILAGDFHVHAAPADGSLLPWELQREMRRAGLDVAGVTNHNSIVAGRFAQAWASYFGGPIAIAGEEITSPDYHMAAIGLTRAVDRRNSAASAIGEIHAQGGVAIAAHPARKYWGGFEGALSLLDGAEVAPPAHWEFAPDFAAFFENARRHNPGIAAIGSSDFHGWPALGERRTYLLAREHSMAGVLEAIRAGRTVAEDETGMLTGEMGLVALVEANRPQGRVDTNAGWRRLSVTLAWIGLLGLLLLRGSAR